MAIHFTIFLNHSLALFPSPESAEKEMKTEEIKELNLCEATFSDLLFNENFRAEGIATILSPYLGTKPLL